MVADAYKELFALHGNSAWELDQDRLISFFRANDQTSADLGRRQANTFQTLASIAGHLEIVKKEKPRVKSKTKATSGASRAKKKAPKDIVQKPKVSGDTGTIKGSRDFGLTVRIEIFFLLVLIKRHTTKFFAASRKT